MISVEGKVRNNRAGRLSIKPAVSETRRNFTQTGWNIETSFTAFGKGGAISEADYLLKIGYDASLALTRSGDTLTLAFQSTSTAREIASKLKDAGYIESTTEQQPLQRKKRR